MGWSRDYYYLYYYWFRTNSHILQYGSQLTKLQEWNWMYIWGFASTIERESSVPRGQSACRKQTITWWNLMLSVYSNITLLYTCLPLTLKGNNTTNVARGFELDLYGSEQTRQWTLRFHPCNWIPWQPEHWTILQESSWWRQLASYLWQFSL